MLIFGTPDQTVRYTDRRAAYVVIKHGDSVAMVGAGTKHFLPGGGSLSGETPEQTIAREVLEELGQHVRLLHRIGEAIQYFYSATDDRYYKMTAVFFAGEIAEPINNVAGGIKSTGCQ